MRKVLIMYKFLRVDEEAFESYIRSGFIAPESPYEGVHVPASFLLAKDRRCFMRDICSYQPISAEEEDIPTTLHQLFCYPRVGTKLLEAAIYPTDCIINDTRQLFSELQRGVFLKGNGVGKPLGLLNHDWAEQTTHLDKWSLKGLAGFFSNFPRKYEENANILIGVATNKKLRRFLSPRTLALHPEYIALRDFVRRKRIYVSRHVPENTILLADFKKTYTIFDRHDMRVVRKQVGTMVTFTVAREIGGCVTGTDAIRILKIKE